MKKVKTSIYQITFISLMSALLCILGPISIPIGPVPISLTNFAVCLSVGILGMKSGAASCCIYLLLGMVGLPVFSGFSGGVGRIAGPTGGYLVGFIIMAVIGGFIMEKSRYNKLLVIIGWLIGIAADYFCGTLWFMYVTNYTFMQALSVCVIPFVAFDVVKIVLAVILAFKVRKILVKAGFSDRL